MTSNTRAILAVAGLAVAGAALARFAVARSPEGAGESARLPSPMPWRDRAYREAAALGGPWRSHTSGSKKTPPREGGYTKNYPELQSPNTCNFEIKYGPAWHRNKLCYSSYLQVIFGFIYQLVFPALASSTVSKNLHLFPSFFSESLQTFLDQLRVAVTYRMYEKSDKFM